MAASFNLRSRERTILASIVAFSTLLRLWFGYQFFGFHTGDDVEILQASFMRAFDHGYIPWEIRNLFLSDMLISPVLGLASLMGIESVRHLCWIASFPFVVLASVNIVLVYLLGVRWLKEPWAATLAASLYAFHWLPLGYGSTVYPRTVSTTCVLVAVLLLHKIRRTGLGYAAAGAMVGVAFTIRYSEAIFLLPIFALLVLNEVKPIEKIRCSLALGIGFTATTLITVGLWDLVTWERPFSSLIEFAKYTLIEQEASSMQRFQPWYWYLLRMPKWLPLTVLPLFFALGDYRRLRAPILYSALPLLMLSLIHHKDMRYLQGIIPFIAIAVAGAAFGWWQLGRRRATVVLMILSVFFGVALPTFVVKKSMAAVLAAESISAETGISVIAVSQSWAYGGTLFLPEGVEVRELGAYPNVTDLDRVVPGCRWVGLYSDRLQQVPELESRLREHGFEVAEKFEWGMSRSVVVFRPSAPDGIAR